MQIASLRLFAAQEIGVVQSACVISALNSLLPSSGQHTGSHGLLPPLLSPSRPMKAAFTLSTLDDTFSGSECNSARWVCEADRGGREVCGCDGRYWVTVLQWRRVFWCITTQNGPGIILSVSWRANGLLRPYKWIRK